MEKMKPDIPYILAAKKEEKKTTNYCIQFKTIEGLEGLISLINRIDGVDITQDRNRKYVTVSVYKNIPKTLYEQTVNKIDSYINRQ